MKTQSENRLTRILPMVQNLLLEEMKESPITPSLIDEKIELVLSITPSWRIDLDKQQVIDELVRRFSLRVGYDTSLKSDLGHINWLVKSRKKDWRYWARYRDWQSTKLSPLVIEKLDNSTDTVLGLLEDPLREGQWDRRGLVVGHVQSGKTGHYTGLICKAADAGYKIIIVLAGMHNNLRSQTQVRLDEGFLGYETKPMKDGIGPKIGVGLIDGDASIRPNFVTNRSDKGDFSNALVKNLGITPEERPWLFVVKKNKTVLTRLLSWMTNHVANTKDENGRKVVTNLPLLMIDDEADHASVDTGEQLFDCEGNPDTEHEPTAINRSIRRILNLYTRSSYVGYTATPFANIFIHERSETKEDGPDLFPSAFIVNLSAPSNYVGPAKVFGLGPDDSEELPLVRLINDYASDDGVSGWMPHRHKNGHVPLYNGEDKVPPSLMEAINAFLISCGIRHLRGQKQEHSSMLIHVTRFNSVQERVHHQVEQYVRYLKQRIDRKIDCEEILEKLANLYENDFVQVSNKLRKNEDESDYSKKFTWHEVLEVLPEVLSDLQVKMINGAAKDALEYTDYRNVGLKVIAIGGDKLARGLTLEGLSVSYFLRASRMYDTLMQMGRWFGYRPGYLDLCRLYTTSELSEWFSHISDAAEELRQEFDLMAASGSTPREYGLKVQSHPVLMVTSRLKMRSAKNLMLSFSGDLLETIAFFRDKNTLQNNLLATKEFLSQLGNPCETDPKRLREGSKQEWKGFLWSKVKSQHIIDFLQSYKTHQEAYKVNSPLIADFIHSMNREGELTEWTVFVIGSSSGEGGQVELGSNILLENMIVRSRKGAFEKDRYSIGRLMSSRDEGIDLSDEEWKEALLLTRKAWQADPGRKQKSKEEPLVPNGPAIRRIRGFGSDSVIGQPERGVLFIYAIDSVKSDDTFEKDTPPVIAFAISFPSSNSAQKVEYKVNNVEWEQRYG